MSGFSHIHIPKMFEITVTTANDENTAKYHTDGKTSIVNDQAPPTAEIRPVVLTEC